MSGRTLAISQGVTIDIPDPDDIHYSAKVPTDLTTREAAGWWLHEAQKAMLYELAEEIEAGQHEVGSNWWKAQVYRRALELIQADEDMRPAYKMSLHKTIEDEALYSYAGYESAEEWFTSESSLRKGGYASDLKWWGAFLIPWVKEQKIFGSDELADRWFFTPVNTDGSSRHGALRDATSDLRDIADRNVYDLPPSEQKLLVKNILAQVENIEMSRSEKKAALNEVRSTKMELNIYQNGDGKWHVAGDLTDHQKERLFRDLQFSAIIKQVDPPEPTEGD